MKKLLAMLLTGAMVFSVAACGSNEEQTSSEASVSSETKTQESSAVEEEPEEIVTLKMYLLGNPVATSDFAPVLEAMNEITREEIGAELDITFMDGGTMKEKMPVIMASGEVYDICWTGYANSYANAVTNGALYDLTDLISSSEIIKAAVPEGIMQYTLIDGRSYGVPCMQAMSVPYGIHLRKDLVEKYDFDWESCTSLADYEPFFAAVAENEPGMIAFNTDDSLNNWAHRHNYGDFGYGLVLKLDGSTEIQSIYELPEFREDVELIRSFYEKGYISKDALTYDRANVDADITAGKYASWARGTKPGAEAEDFSKYGFETVTKRIAPAVYSSPTNTVMSVSATSENPEKAFEMIELLNSNGELMNLICYGVEGTHYNLNDAGKIVLDSDAKYSQSGFTWAFGNQFTLTLTESQPDGLWETTIELNNSAKPSFLQGFSLPTEVSEALATEYAMYNAIYEEYKYIIANGVKDPDEYWDELKERVADIQEKIKEAYQPYVDEWRANKK